MSESVYAGLTSQTIDVLLYDSSSTTGAGLAGLVYNSSGLSCYYRKGATGTSAVISLADISGGAGGAWISGGFIEVDSTNMPGVYRFDIPNVVVNSEGFVTVYFQGATNLQPSALRIDCRPLPSDLKKIQTDAQSVTDLKDFADAGYDPATNKVQGVVLVDTTTTNTDMRGTDSAFLAANAPANFSDLAITSTTGQVDVGMVLGTALTETSAGNLADNISFFYDLDTTTTNTVDDVGGGSGLDAAGVRAAIGLASANLDTQLDALPTTAEVNAQVDSALADYDGPTNAEMIAAFTEIKGATWSSSTDTLEAIRNRGDVAWTTATTSTVITALGLYGAALDSKLTDVYAFTDATLTAVNGLNDISTADVLTQVTSGLNTYDGPTKAEMDAAFTQIKGATWSTTDTLEQIRDNLGAGGGDATEAKQDIIIAALGVVDGNVDSILVDTGTTLPATLSTILADTNELQTNQGNWITADVSGLATAAALSSVASNVGEILTDTGTTIPGTLSTIGTNVSSILTDTGTTLPGLITTVDTVVDAIKVKTDQITFGVAGQINANITYINEIEVQGAGIEANLWRGIDEP